MFAFGGTRLSSRLILSSFIAVCGSAHPALPVKANTLQTSAPATVSAREVSLAPSIEQELKDAISQVYGDEQTPKIYDRVLALAQKTRAERPADLQRSDLERRSDWYKNEIIYMFYADQFGVKTGDDANTFGDLTGMLDYLRDLGVTTLYILPYLDSPMGDAGFDVKDARNVRKDLGRTVEFKRFFAEARARGFKLKSDLILNHVSDQHRWFQEALRGDQVKMNYFLVTDKMPKFRKYRDLQKGVVIDYTEDDGSVSSRRLMFPEISENHYRRETINGKNYYFYHTFYPFQIDINWKNPKVLYEVLDIIAYWENLGVDIFRFDAIPYLIKDKGTDGANRPGTHAIVRILSLFMQATAPRSIMQAEACQWPKDILPYFGKEKTYRTETNGLTKNLTRTDEVQIAYNFPYMPAMWASLLTGDNKHFWMAYAATPEIPESAAWGMFLRVHDELTLEMVDIPTRKLVYDQLISKGAKFRDGLGVAGRLSEFLDKNPDRISQSFAMLLSMPGVPILYYGDEIAAGNNFGYAKFAERQREANQKANHSDLRMLSYYDSRDINRGPINREAFYAATKPSANTLGARVYRHVKTLIRVRRDNAIMSQGRLLPVRSDKTNVLSYARTNERDAVVVVHNLSSKPTTASLALPNSMTDTERKAFVDAKYWRDLTSGRQLTAARAGSSLKISLRPYESLWLRANPLLQSRPTRTSMASGLLLIRMGDQT